MVAARNKESEMSEAKEVRNKAAVEETMAALTKQVAYLMVTLDSTAPQVIREIKMDRK